MIKILQGDCLIKLEELEDNSVDSIVTDPPYELGFMGKAWDNTGIANNPLMWAECLRVLKPGGHLLAFSGTRTYHRMASAIEDAGFEIRDMIEWVYGSGFPKSLNIVKAVDKLQGNEREVTGTGSCGYQVSISKKRVEEGYRPNLTNATSETIITKGTSEYEGWGTALKPAHEPICMARKPLEKGLTVAENCLKWGTGGINIDESRVGNDLIPCSNDIRSLQKWKELDGRTHKELINPEPTFNTSRFLANLIHDNSEEVRECFPESKSCGGKNPINVESKFGQVNNKEQLPFDYGDSGNASRFFKSIIYQAKSSKAERNKGCEGLEEKQYSHDGRDKESENAFQRNKSIATNYHPTVKPIALMSYLIKMVTPKGRIVLDPFMGSGSTGVACKENGFSFIGIEMEAEYIKIAEARINDIDTSQTKLEVKSGCDANNDGIPPNNKLLGILPTIL